MNEEHVGKVVLDAAFKVHSALGPGLLESVYEAALARELERRGLRVERQKAIPVHYEGETLEVGFRADLIVENLVMIELKSVDMVIPVFRKVATNYLRLIPLRLGFLVNFNELHLKDGITRIVHGLDGKPSFPQRKPPTNPVLYTGNSESEPCEQDSMSSSQPSLPSPPSRELPVS